ncbi:hypothetical protein LINPERHAP1_LOCUS11689 [Linum perenne]
MTNSEIGECGMGNTEPNLSGCDKQLPVSAKKAALRDVQNQNRSHINFISTSPLTKNGGQSMDTVKVSGTKRPSPESPAGLPRNQSPNSSAASAQLVYVRRKSEAETAKINAGDRTSLNSNSPVKQQLGHSAETTNQLKSPANEPKVYRLSAFAPMATGSITSTSGKPSVSVPVAQSTPRFASVQSSYRQSTAVPLSADGREMKRERWEERYRQLQALLKKLDESDQKDYIQMLQSLSSVELSRHAVELEKRSIKLSLEEAKEIHRVAFLNILGRNLKQPPSVQQLQSSK